MNAKNSVAKELNNILTRFSAVGRLIERSPTVLVRHIQVAARGNEDLYKGRRVHGVAIKVRRCEGENEPKSIYNKIL